MNTRQIIVGLIIVLILFLVFFSREPNITKINEGITSPAYGRVYKILQTPEQTTISIVLDIFDIHVQYYPTDGTVIDHIYDRTGKFNLIFDLNKSALNEKLITRMRDADGDLITVTQIAGLMTRRIVWTDKTDTKVTKGSKLGRILLGSRVDITLPAKYKISVQENDYVNGPESTIAIK